MNNKTKIKFPKIRVSSSIINQIAEEVEATTESVRLSLQFRRMSPLAVKIRERAKELLLEEAAKVDDIEIED